jgi:hypothetical protein
MPRLNPEPPRCAWCDARLPNQSALIAHERGHRHDTELRSSAEDLASGLEKAADAGLRAQAGLGAGSPGSDA